MGEEKITTDFYLACFIEIKLNKLCEIRKHNDNKRAIFVFNKDEFDRVVRDYYSNDSIGIIDIKNKVKDLKSRIVSYL